jgi:hypothetical protein
MTYRYHVFLSYRRHGEWPLWVENIFLPIFTHYLGEELGEETTIFFDKNMEKGVAWPQELGNALAGSCVLVPLWSRQYFNSPWCKAELAYMRSREDRCGFRTPERPEGLIVPAIIHDGDDLPDEARILNPLCLQKYTNIRVAQYSPTLEELANQIQAWAPDIVRAIERAPDYDATWLQLAVDKFIDLFKVPPSRQRILPRLDAI